MPRDFYPDTDRTGLKPVKELCYATVTMFDGPGICKRAKGHGVNDLRSVSAKAGSFHQEEYEGWVWDDKGRIS